jgi:branched-chain amino acid transport system permease protein
MGINPNYKMSGSKNRNFCIAAVLFLLFIPAITLNNNYLMHFLVLCFIWGVTAEAWNLIMGYAGIFSFGQIAFFTIGAFAAGLLSLQLGVSPWLGMPLAGLITACVGFLIGLPSLRLKGEYIALVTYALHMLLGALVFRGKAIGIETGGFLWNIPSLTFFGYEFPRNAVISWYYLGLVLFLLFLLFIYWIIHSPIGRAFVALRDAEPLAQSLGIDQFKYKLIVFSLSAFITGVMGAFYAYYVAVISSRMLGLDFFVKALIMVLLGGIGRFPGAAIGAFIITIGYEAMRPLMSYRLIVLGIFVILTIIYLPGGILGGTDYIEKIRKWRQKNKELLSQ